MNEQLRQIRRQSSIPLVFRNASELMVKLPYDLDNRTWLHKGRRSQPQWDSIHKCWLLPRSAFSELTKRILAKHGKCYVVQPHNEKEVCAPACWNAHGLECECSCLGKNHGSLEPSGRWYVISETYAVQWGEKSYRWSLLKAS